MIIAKEKYNDTYIVYIDESKEEFDGSPWQIYQNIDTPTLLTNIFYNSFRVQRLGERRMDIL